MGTATDLPSGSHLPTCHPERLRSEPAPAKAGAQPSRSISDATPSRTRGGTTGRSAVLGRALYAEGATAPRTTGATLYTENGGTLEDVMDSAFQHSSHLICAVLGTLSPGIDRSVSGQPLGFMTSSRRCSVHCGPRITPNDEALSPEHPAACRSMRSSALHGRPVGARPGSFPTLPCAYPVSPSRCWGTIANTTAAQQPQVHNEDPDALAPFVDAQPTRFAPLDNQVVSGVTQSYSNVDTYRFNSLASAGQTYGGLLRQYVWGRYPGVARPNTGALYQRVDNTIDYSLGGKNDSRPVSYSLVALGDQLQSVVAFRGSELSADSTTVTASSNFPSEPAPYQLVNLFRLQATQVALEATNERDVRADFPVYDCTVDLNYWYYRNVDISDDN